ncbi:sensor histidine kinase [Nesterenkonia alba]|uniref:sensor histidine kinase n=1 Tax=Nesterenkonia alba TaxID=515814 RepID=UPI0003B50F9A|nr:histidine kinase [Nesterenkonia alba]
MREGIITQCGKIALILRLLCTCPVVLIWAETRDVVELLLLLTAIGLSLVALLGWERVAPLLRRHPVLISADILITLLIFLNAPTPSAYLGYLAATALLVGIFCHVVSCLLMTGFVAVGYFAVMVYQSQRHEDLSIGPTSAVVSVVLFAVVAYVGQSMRALQDQVNEALDGVRTAAAEAALGRERSRLARELHDSLVKTLVGIDLHAQALKASGAAGEGAEQISAAAKDAVRESRRLLTGMRTAAVPSLAETLEHTAVELQAMYPVCIEVDVDEPAALSPQLRYELAKIACEALRNAAQHSGTDQIRCAGWVAAGRFYLRVTDYGQGFSLKSAEKSGHYGLAGMRDRAHGVGAEFEIDTETGSGTRVTLNVALETSAARGDEGKEREPDTARADRR